MTGLDFKTLALVGRDRELDRLKLAFGNATEGKGAFSLISGEPGIGKTRLLDEYLADAGDTGRVLYGASTADSLHPYQIFSRALESVIDPSLFSEEVETSFSQVMLVDLNGLLISKVSRLEGEMDADIFAAMFSAVQSFVADSLDKAGEAGTGLGRLEYGNLGILIEHGRGVFATGVYEGIEHPDMKRELKRTLAAIEKEHSEILERWSGDADSVGPITEKLGALVSRTFKVKAGPESIDLESERTRIANTVLGALKAFDGPLVLVLEDLHWADESSLAVLGFLARNLASERIHMVGTARPGEGPAFQRLLEAMKDDGSVDLLELKALGSEAVRDIIDAVYAPNDFPIEFKDGLVDRCRGNPFFVLEILRQMSYDGNVGSEGGRHVLVTGEYTLPGTLEDVVYRRLESLEPDAMALAEYASCIGREFDCPALMSLDTITDPEGAFDKAQRHQILLRHNGTGEFLHAIYQSVIYGDLGERWRSTYHRSLGRYYEGAYKGHEDSVIYELAKHFSRANDKAKGYEYSRRAGEMAEAAYASEQAVEHYRTALGILKALPEREVEVPGLMERLADSYRMVGEMESALDLYAELETRLGGQADGTLRILLKSSSALHAKGDFVGSKTIFEKGVPVYRDAGARMKAEFLAGYARQIAEPGSEKALKYLEEATRALEDIEEPEVRANILALLGDARYRAGGLREAGDLFVKAVEMAEMTGDPRLIAGTRRALGGHLHFQGEYAESMRIMEEVLEMQEKLGDIAAMYTTLNSLGISASDNNELEKSVECHRRALDIARKLGNKAYLATTLGNLGYTHLLMGNTEEALRHQEESLAIRESYEGREATAWSLSDLALIHFMNDDLEKAMEYHQRSLEIWRADKYLLGISLALGYIGDTYNEMGEREMGRFHLFQAIEVARENDIKSAQVYAMTGLARYFDLDAKRFDEFETLARQLGRTDVDMMVLKHRAEYAVREGDLDRANGLIEKAESLALDRSVIMVQLELAGLDLVRAKIHDAGGGVDKAKELAFSAAAAYDRWGRKLEARKARELASSFIGK